MKIIDKTPYYQQNGELSIVDRARAIMKYGPGWFKEVEAQKSVVAVLDKNLDKRFTLLLNSTPPALGATIPLILVGPTGVYAMCVTNFTGTLRAKGDQWGTINGNTFKPEKPNLLTRTERMARAIQVFLQRQGYADLTSVEAVLLCADPALHVDSMRPIIRIVMRDALERFTVTIAQGRAILNPESVFDIVNRLQTLPAPPEPEPVESASPAAIVAENEPAVPGFVQPGSDAMPAFPGDISPLNLPAAAPARRRPGINRKQWIFLIIMFVIWCLIIAVFAFLIVKDLNPQLFLPR
jgi:hypothetical protein